MYGYRVVMRYELINDVCDFFFQAEDDIRDLVRSRGLGDVYKRQVSQCRPIGDRDVGDPSSRLCRPE